MSGDFISFEMIILSRQRQTLKVEGNGNIIIYSYTAEINVISYKNTVVNPKKNLYVIEHRKQFFFKITCQETQQLNCERYFREEKRGQKLNSETNNRK